MLAKLGGACKKLRKIWVDRGYSGKLLEWVANGKKEGKIEEKQAIAKSMLAEKLPLELIVKLTGLTEQEIQKL